MPDIAELKLVDTSELKSTTARLLVSFAQGYFKVPGMPLDSTMKRSTIVYSEFGELSERLLSTSDNASIRGVTKEILEKLKTATAPSAKAAYDTLIRDAEPALKHSEELDQGESVFSKTSTEERAKALEALGNVLTAVASAQNPEEKAHSQEILNQLEKAEKTSNNLNIAFEKLIKARSTSDTQLRSISHKAYEALPTKVGVTPPPAVTPTLTGRSS